MTKSPCKDCEFRHTYCHASCEIYRDWSTAVREERIHTSKQRAALDAMWDYNGRKKKK